MHRIDRPNPLHGLQYEVRPARQQAGLREINARETRPPKGGYAVGALLMQTAEMSRPPFCSGDRDSLSNRFKPTALDANEPTRLLLDAAIRDGDEVYIQSLIREFRALRTVTAVQSVDWTTRLLPLLGDPDPPLSCMPPNAEHLRACRAYAHLVTLCAADLDREQRDVLREALFPFKPPSDRYPKDGFTEADSTPLAHAFRQYRDEFERMLSALDDPVPTRLCNADLFAIYAREDGRTLEAYDHIAISDRTPTATLRVARNILRHVRHIYRAGNKSGNKLRLSRRIALEHFRFLQMESHVVPREADLERRINTDYVSASAHNCLELTTMACRKALADGLCVAYVYTGSHSFAVLGDVGKEEFDAQVRAWNGKLEDAFPGWIVCDPWSNLACPVAHYRALFGAKMQRWEHGKQLRHPFGGWVTTSKKIDALLIGGTATAYSFKVADGTYLLAANNEPSHSPIAL